MIAYVHAFSQKSTGASSTASLCAQTRQSRRRRSQHNKKKLLTQRHQLHASKSVKQLVRDSDKANENRRSNEALPKIKDDIEDDDDELELRRLALESAFRQRDERTGLQILLFPSDQHLNFTRDEKGR